MPTILQGHANRTAEALRCPAHKGIVVNAVVIAGRTLGLAVPERHGTYRIGLENDLSDCVADDLGDAAAQARGGLAQGVEFFLAKINLHFFHVCQFGPLSDIRQEEGVPRRAQSLSVAMNRCAGT